MFTIPHTSPHPNSPQLPAILETFARKVGDYLLKPDLLPTLQFLRGNHQQRSERRAAICAALSAMIRRMDLITLRIGRPTTGGGFAGLTVEKLATEAGISTRRFERALHDLTKAGFVRVHQICRKTDTGGFRGLAAIRTISPLLAKAVGIGSWLVKERKKTADRESQRLRDAEARKQDRATAGLLARLGCIVSTNRPALVFTPPPRYSAPIPKRRRVPAPTPTRPHVPAPTPTNPHVPAPTPTPPPPDFFGQLKNILKNR